MKIIRALLLSLLLAGPAHAAIDAALVGTATSGSGTTLTTGSGTTSASGITCLIALSFDSSVTQSNVRDSKSNTYTLTGTVQSGNGNKKALYRSENCTGGASHTASADFSGSPFGTIYLIVITGAATASFDVTTQVNDTNSPYGVATGTLAQAAEVIVTLVGNGESNNPMSYTSSNMTVLAQEGNGSSFWTSAVLKQVVASTASFTSSITSAGSSTDAPHNLVNATFKEAAGGGGGPSNIPRVDHYKRLMGSWSPGEAANDDVYLLRATR